MMIKNIILFTFVISTLISCSKENKTEFTAAALSEKADKLSGESISVDEIIKNNESENLMIEIWASWCADCIKALPKVAEFQKEHPEVKFVFISVDDDDERWEKGVEKYMKKFDVKGEQYHFSSGWDKSGDNAFIDFIGLDWIPRYMLIGKDEKIKVYYSKSIEDKNILENL